MLITFEGLPGAGKSTQAELLARCLRDRGRPVTTLPDLATLETEPVAATLVQLLRTGGDPFLRTGDAITDTLITAAIRADLVATVLDPALATSPGAAVVEDRGIHTMASYAIASLLQEHRAAADVALDWLDALTTLAGPRPAHALWLRLPPDLAAQRAAERSAGTSPPLNAEHRAYLKWVNHAYELLAERDQQLTVLDVADLDPLRTHQAVHQVLIHIDQPGDHGITTCAGRPEPSGTPPRLSTPEPRPPLMPSREPGA